ncbi:hypothetical protein AGMMS49975_02690 [Clostridia bacterium]|nr:hypothetical protein AGMMS49975_02690 [Clostridia bacterium]
MEMELTSDLLVPNPIRNCPKRLDLNAQTAELALDEEAIAAIAAIAAGDLSSLYTWNHIIDFSMPAIGQDTHRVEIQYDGGTILKKNLSADLFDVLCRYDYVRGELLKGVLDFEDSFSDFVDITESIAGAWKAGITPKLSLANSGKAICTLTSKDDRAVYSNDTQPKFADYKGHDKSIDCRPKVYIHHA